MISGTLPKEFAENARRYTRGFLERGAKAGFLHSFCPPPFVHFRGGYDGIRLVVFGRDPGYSEYNSLSPFCGPGGKRLQGLLENLGMHDAPTGRKRYLVTNLVRAHPPGNRFHAPTHAAAVHAMRSELEEVVALARESARGREPVVVIAGKTTGRLGREIFPDAFVLTHPSPLGDGGRFERDVNGGQGEALAKILGVEWRPLEGRYARPIPENDFPPGGAACARVRKADPSNPCMRHADAVPDPYADAPL